MLLSNENRNVRNISVEDQKSHKHSLLEVEALSKYVCDPIILKKDVYNSKDNWLSKNISNHSPLLTKRKISQKRGGNNTVRNKNKHQKNYSKLVSLNTNLRGLSQNAKEEWKSTER